MYISEDALEFAMKHSGFTEKGEYLQNFIFPDEKTIYKDDKTRDSIVRIGDFAEILISDFFEYIKQFWVPRTRYDAKDHRNFSTRGTDIIGIKLIDDSLENPNDQLITVEVKANIAKTPNPKRLLEAITDAQKDPTRFPETLSVMGNRFYREGKTRNAEIVFRFCNPLDKKFKVQHTAAAFFTNSNYEEDKIKNIDVSFDKYNLNLFLFHGEDLLTLCQNLYKRAADEA